MTKDAEAGVLSEDQLRVSLNELRTQSTGMARQHQLQTKIIAHNKALRAKLETAEAENRLLALANKEFQKENDRLREGLRRCEQAHLDVGQP